MNVQPWSWLYATCFLDIFGASMIMPVFGSHLRSLGISHSNVGILSSVYGISQLISGPIIGSWSDVNGRRVILYLTSIICSIGYGLMGAISSFHVFLIIRCLLGLFKHTQTLCRAFTADIVPRENQANVHGLMNAVTSFSFMIGPVISGHVMESENGFQFLSVIVSFIFILNAVVIFLISKSKQSNENRIEESSFLKKVTAVFRELYVIDWRSFWPLFTIKFLFALTGILFFQNMDIILTENYKLSPRHIGYTISFYGLISGVSNLTTGKLKSMFLFNNEPTKSLSLTFCVMTLTLYVLFQVNSFPVFIAGLVPLASSHALGRILMTEMILESSDETFRGSMMGASSSLAAIARIMAPTIGGVLMSWGGVCAPLLMSSVTAAVAAILITVIHPALNHEKYS